MDPITGHGIGHAFRQAELVVAALDDALRGGRPLDAALAAYQRQRDSETVPMYDFTTNLASSQTQQGWTVACVWPILPQRGPLCRRPEQRTPAAV
jgi:2-polyprenyl-6-methoxyphenol hydroxylase-like FAD-dependent oxidoreductase